VLYDKVVQGKQWEVRDYEGTVMLPPLASNSAIALAELRFWVECIWKIRGARVKEVTRTACFVDACPQGAEAVVARRLRAGERVQWNIEQLRGGAWEERVSESNTIFELLNN
jgi:hypothetical protein